MSTYFSVTLPFYHRRLEGKDNLIHLLGAFLTQDSLEEGTFTFERNQKQHASKNLLCIKTQQHLTIELSKGVTDPVYSAAYEPSHGSSRDNTPAPNLRQRAEMKPALLLLTQLRPLPSQLANSKQASAGLQPSQGSKQTKFHSSDSKHLRALLSHNFTLVSNTTHHPFLLKSQQHNLLPN